MQEEKIANRNNRWTDTKIHHARSIHLDLLKTIAIFLVCFYHVKLEITGQSGYRNYNEYINYFINGVAAVSIPIFFMVNGALLLSRDYDFEKHLYKTIKLFVLVYVWGSLTLAFYMYALSDQYSLSGFLWALWDLKVGRINHLWFLKTMVLIYLLFPIIKTLFDNPDKKNIILLSSLLFVFSFGNLFLNWAINIARFVGGFEGFDIAKNDRFDFFRTINPFGSHFFSVFYFILGGYLADKIRKGVRISSGTLLAGFLVSWLLLFLYGIMRYKQTGHYYDIVWEWYSMPTLIMSLSAFLLMRNININNSRIAHFISVIGKNTLGIYLIHVLIDAWLHPYFANLDCSKYLLSNLAYAAAIMLISLFTAILIRRVPIMNKSLSL
jgi:surface polysaccharide O-acyltransferase-like enzyme